MTTVKKTTNYKKWAFRFFIYLIIINIVTIYITLHQTDLAYNAAQRFKDMDATRRVLYIFGWLSNLLFLSGMVLTVLSIVKKEPRDYQWYTAVIGWGLFLLLFISVFYLGTAILI